MSAFTIEAEHGWRAFRFVAVDATSETALLLKGPTGTQPYSDVHAGAFLIPSRRSVSIQATFAAETEIYVDLYCQWYYRDVRKVLLRGPVTGPHLTRNFGGGTPPAWTKLDLTLSRRNVPAETSHWRPKFVFFTLEEDGSRTPLVEGVELFVDSIYLPDNGISLIGEPYLDGDQPYGQWEGGPRNSSSVYRATPGSLDVVDPNSVALTESLVAEEEE